MSFILAMVMKFCNQYEEADDPVVFLSSEQIVLNDKVTKDRIITVKPGKKMFTYHILIAEGDSLVVDFHN